MTTPPSPSSRPFDPAAAPRMGFVGGGNMASAIIGGLIAGRHPPDRIVVVEPQAPQAAVLRDKFGVRVEPAGGAALAGAQVIVWAVKPQVFGAAAAPCAAVVSDALHLSGMAGIRSDSIARAVGGERVVRAMPNTPALIGEGVTGLFARAAVTADDRATTEAVIAPTGGWLWVRDEQHLDAVTALSGSGPAYVFFFLEAMMQAAADMGLEAEQGRRLALATFKGATALACACDEPPETLRGRVTSKGGTTYAAIAAMEAAGVKPAIVQALRAAQRRARELGDEFSRPEPSPATPPEDPPSKV
ncbi:MAG: pyrroline-5-carboxylate reductase [Burkholderiaceae bacterium]